MNSSGSCQRQEAPGSRAALSKVLEGGSFNPPSTSPPVLPGLSWLRCEMRPACHVRADCSASEHTLSEEPPLWLSVKGHRIKIPPPSPQSYLLYSLQSSLSRHVPSRSLWSTRVYLSWVCNREHECNILLPLRKPGIQLRRPNYLNTHTHTTIWDTGWRRIWLPTPVFLPGEFHGQRSLVG